MLILSTTFCWLRSGLSEPSWTMEPISSGWNNQDASQLGTGVSVTQLRDSTKANWTIRGSHLISWLKTLLDRQKTGPLEFSRSLGACQMSHLLSKYAISKKQTQKHNISRIRSFQTIVNTILNQVHLHFRKCIAWHCLVKPLISAKIIPCTVTSNVLSTPQVSNQSTLADNQPLLSATNLHKTPRTPTKI